MLNILSFPTTGLGAPSDYHLSSQIFLLINVLVSTNVQLCLSAMSHLRFCRAILSRDSDARQSRSLRLHSRTLRLWRSVIRIAGSHVCLSHAASKSQRATMKSQAATLSRVRVARQNHATKSRDKIAGVTWHLVTQLSWRSLY